MNKRFTIQKQMIEDALRVLDHPTAAEVYEEIKKAYLGSNSILLMEYII